MDLMIKMIAQEELILLEQSTVFSLYYKAEATDAEPSCPDFDEEFLEAVKVTTTITVTSNHQPHDC